MRSFAYLAAVAATAAVAAPAFAQGAPVAGTGLRLEGLAGWDRTQVNGGHEDGVAYGIGAGYDMAMGGAAIVGADVELTDASTKECAGARTALSPEFCAKAGRDIYVGGRIGTDLRPGTRLYAKAGYTNARYKLTSDAGQGDVTLDRANLDGFRVGAGAEQALTANSFVKAEYRYSNYEQGISRHQVLGGFGMRF
ncbi:MAG: outer membrane beta-barrel protein [Sphingomonas fennica]